VTLSRNLIAGLISSAWSALIGLAAIPFYLQYLGIESYGLIGFFITTQSLLLLLDMGMSSTINREVARHSASGSLEKAGNLLHSLAVIYWSVAFLIAALILASSSLIAEYWLKSSQLPVQTITNAVMLMGIVIACRWPIGLYQGVLIGAQRLIIVSAVNITMVTVSNIGAILILAFSSPTIEAYFMWQALVGFIYAILMRTTAWQTIGKSKSIRFDISYIKNVLHFTLGVGAISFSGLLLTQLDKIILSKTIGLDSFGKYMLANTMASSLYIFIIPIFNSIYPRFSSLVAQHKVKELLELYQTLSRLLSALLFPAAMAITLIAYPLVHLWTGDELLARDISPILSILLIAYAMHGVMHIPYALMLAEGETRSMFKLYTALIVITVPLTLTLSIMYGVIGGAVAQLLLFLIYMVLGSLLTHKKYFKGYAKKWLVVDIGSSLAISLLFGFLGYFLLSVLAVSIFSTFLVGILCWIIASLLSIYTTQSSRLIFISFWNKFRLR
jgi:O-antigen/teichoic acid export membrane protein